MSKGSSINDVTPQARGREGGTKMVILVDFHGITGWTRGRIGIGNKGFVIYI